MKALRWLRTKAAQFFTPLSLGASHDFGWSSMTILPRTQTNYAKEVGDGLGSSVLMSPIKWIQRTFPEATLEVIRNTNDGSSVERDHPLCRLIARPNEAYTGMALWAGTLFSWIVSGDAYWIKVREPQAGIPWHRNVTGAVKQLWYVPHWFMEPRWPADGLTFIDHYNYQVTTQQLELPLENVVHFRNGLDPRNPRHGLSLVYSELREIFTDDEAANFTSSLLKNMGVPGIVVSPETKMGSATISDAESVKAWFRQQFGGDRRGEPLVMSGPTKVEQYGFSPEQLKLGDIRDIAEERICAALGIPAAVIGFGTGLQQTKVGATMQELKRLAWEGCIIPMQAAFARQLAFSLLSEFEAVPDSLSVRFNQDSVSAMQENRRNRAETLNVMVQGGWLRVDEAQRMMGLEVDATQNVYLRSLNIIEVLASSPKSDRRLLMKRAPSLIVQQVIDSARHGRPTANQSALIARLNRDAQRFTKMFLGELQDFFDEFGAAIAVIALDILEPLRPKSDADEILGDEILARLDIEASRIKLQARGGAHYQRVAQNAIASLNVTIGAGFDLSDIRAREIVAAGGRRLGLIDLSKSTRARLFRELAEGRAAGDGPVALARRIREFVPAGASGSIQSRASTIARTETLHAQRMSVLEASRDAPNVQEVMVFDNRTDFDDEECPPLDGAIVSIDEAWDLMNDEHPNGTRSFSPIVG